MDDLKISVVQPDVHWENRSANLEYLGKMIEQSDKKSDLIILPEMFTTGFSMNPVKVAESFHPDMESLVWMRKIAATMDAAIVGSISTEEEQKYYNRLFWVFPDGTFKYYDKRHLFSFAGEDAAYSPGAEKLIVEFRGWSICPLICYDLRFPVWSRNSLINKIPEYDLLIYVANWPEVRREPWMRLLHARAIENQCYVVGSNRIGEDANAISYSGDSLIIDPKGDLIYSLQDEEAVFSINLSRSELENFRHKFPVLKDADSFEIE